LGGTVRYFDTAVQALVERRLEALSTGIAQSYGCTATLNYRRLFPATVNAPVETALCRDVLQDLVGAVNVIVDPRPLMASEDFSFMLQAVPGCYVWAGNGGGDHAAKLHSPHYDFNDALIPLGAAYWVRLVEQALAYPGAGSARADCTLASEDTALNAQRSSSNNQTSQQIEE
jgi:hippurate hydrolase